MIFRLFFLIYCIITNCKLFGQIEVSIEEQLIQTTALIQSQISKDRITTGTGFFYSDSILHKGKTFLITNKHVIVNGNTGSITFNKVESNGSLYGNKEVVYLSKFKESWKTHPNPTIDLCFIDITPILNHYKKNGITLFTRSLTRNFIPSDSIWKTLSVLEDVIMIGYPNGIIDSKNNIPIIRTGVTATPPKLDYNGNKEFLIDIAAFPGSSGSPVIIRRTPFGSRQSNNGGVKIGIFPEYYFAGILYAGPTYNPKIKQLNFMPIEKIAQNSQITSELMLNLGNVIKSTEILNMINHNK